jgi:hypothetical protein
MIKPEQIPPEVVEAAVKAFDESEEDAYVTHAHDIRVAIAAALNAWPGIQDAWYEGNTPTAYILPLPQEKPNDR